MNRGIARREVFEDARDARYFLSRLAYAVCAGRIEVYAFCLLTTHFHLLMRGPEGLLSRAIGEVVNDSANGRTDCASRDQAIMLGKPPSRGYTRVIEQRVERTGCDRDPLDDLVGAAPRRVLELMRRKALLAADRNSKRVTSTRRGRRPRREIRRGARVGRVAPRG